MLHRIAVDLRPGEGGTEVGNLQDGLVALIDHGVIHSLDAPMSPTASELAALKQLILRERLKPNYGEGTQRTVFAFQVQQGMGDGLRGAVEARTAEKLNAFLDRIGAFDPEGGGSPGAGTTATLSGTVILEDGRFGTAITLRLYQKVIGGKDRLIKETETDTQGLFSFAFPAKDAVNAEVRAVADGGAEFGLSSIRFNLELTEQMNLVAPLAVRPLSSEYQRLMADLTTSLGGGVGLNDLKESSDQPAVTRLAQSSRWDARLIALAIQAQQIAKETEILPEAAYGLLRSNLPRTSLAVASLDSSQVGAALRGAASTGVVKLSNEEIVRTVELLSTYPVKALVNAVPANALASVNGVLQGSGLSAEDLKTFETQYAKYPNLGDVFWRALGAAGMAPATITRLQLQGKLAYLTSNNPKLTTAVLAKLDLAQPLSQLSTLGFHKSDAWTAVLRGLSDGNADTLGKLIPPAYTGAVADRLAAYSADMALSVRASFPTASVAQMLRQGDLKLSAAAAGTTKETAQMLSNAAGLGYELGQASLDLLVSARAADLYRGIEVGSQPGALNQLKLLHRLVQITPSDASLQAAIDCGFESANQMSDLPFERFSALFGPKFPSANEAELAYRRASQVTATTRHMLVAAKQLATGSGVYAISPAQTTNAAAQASVLKQFPTMAQLFGNLDFCDCEDCNSVLSPAAYFVDLLHFLDPDDSAWTAFKAWWKVTYGTDYVLDKPYATLKSRRPDLEQLPLSCENTNTALPYIDVVNEILEYFIANGQLDGSAARDTGDADSADLIAEPQNILPAAYDKVKLENSSLDLPFDLWATTVRAFFTQFGVSLAQAMESFRTTDELKAGAPANYYRVDVFSESLGLGASERAVFVKPPDWWVLYGYASAADADAIRTAKTLSDRLGVSYAELVSLLQTRFVNPGLDSIALLTNLGLNVVDVLRLKGVAGYPALTADENTELNARLSKLTARFNPGGAAAPMFSAATELDNLYAASQQFQHIIALKSPSAGCDFSATAVAYYGAGGPIQSLDFLRLNLFVRLWRKLGWTIQELDAALAVLFPSDVWKALSAANIGSGLETAIIYLSHLDGLQRELGLDRSARFTLLSLWANLGTVGQGSFYAQLFLAAGPDKTPIAVDDPLGRYLDGTRTYLPNPSALLKDNLPTLQAALNLKSDDIGLILSSVKQSLNGDPTVPLPAAGMTLENVSLLYRHGLLSSALNLTVLELVTLMSYASVNPFKALATAPLATIADDSPFSQTIAFIRLVKALKQADFAVADIAYLLEGRLLDPVGKYAVDPFADLAFFRTLANGLAKIQSDHTIPADPADLTDSRLRQELSLVLPADAVDVFFSMWSGTVSYSKSLQVLAPLNPATYAVEPKLSFSYDAVAKAEDVSYQGVLSKARSQQLSVQFPELAPYLADIAQQAQTFFDQNLLASAGPPTAGFLAAGVFDTLFGPPVAGVDRRIVLAQGLFPFVVRRLSAQFVLQAVSVGVTTSTDVVEGLLNDATLLQDPTRPNTALNDSFQAASVPGVDVKYFATADGSGAPSVSMTLVTVDSSLKSGAGVAMPAGTQSAVFSGFIEVTVSGAYRFYLEGGGPGVKATLTFDEQSSPVFAAPGTDGYLILTAGVAHPFEFSALSLTQPVSVTVQGDSLPRGSMERLTLYPSSAVSSVKRTKVLLDKALQIVSTLDLDFKELRYLVDHRADFDGFDLGKLPAIQGDPTAAAPSVLLVWLKRLADYIALREQVAGGTDGLIDFFGQPLVGTLASLTRRQAAQIIDATAVLGFATTAEAKPEQRTITQASVRTEVGTRRLWEVMRVAAQMGVPAPAIQSWVKPSPTSVIAANLRDTFKAQFDADGWRGIAQPIFDKLRQQQRDALVAYILAKPPAGQTFTEASQLFDYFLVDSQMEPVVQISRVSLAISSVQTFTQRCLLNLESQVRPASINSAQWAWMKRFRVWGASREIFLYPENWLEPEFRDDKTPTFEDLESKLLQGDVSNDLAEDCFNTYLTDLETLARLDIIATCFETAPSADDRKMHVIGRTFAHPHKYFYRQYQHQMWSPWEPVSVDIEGDHVTAVVWHGRLHLFWVTFMVNSQPGTAVSKTTTFDGLRGQQLSTISVKQVQAQLSWTEYFQGKWTTRKASAFQQPIVASFDADTDFNADQVSIYTYLEPAEDAPAGVIIGLMGTPFDGQASAFRMISRLAGPKPVWIRRPLETDFLSRPPSPWPQRQGTRVMGAGPLKVLPMGAQGQLYNAPSDGDYQELLATSPGYESVNGSGYSLTESWTPSSVFAADYFYTASANEHISAIEAAGYAADGIAGYVLPAEAAAQPDSTPLYRIYLQSANPSHFYTIDAAERQNVLNTFTSSDENITCQVFTAPGAGRVRLYRLLVNLTSPTFVGHLYTTDTTEVALAQSAGYTVEAMICYVYDSPQPGTIPLYRTVSAAQAQWLPQQKIAETIDPFFYQDRQHTYYVEPRVEFLPLKNFDGFGLSPKLVASRPQFNANLRIQSQYSAKDAAPAATAAAAFEAAPESKLSLRATTDWTTAKGATVAFGQAAIGRLGGTASRPTDQGAVS